MRWAGNACFRLRGGLLAVLAVFALWCGRPAPLGLLCGLPWALLGEGLRIWAVGYAGEPTRGERLEAPILITAGPYSYVRNPLYVGNLLNALGVATAAFFPLRNDCLLGIVALVAAFYGFLARYEEEFLAGLFGTQYDDYRRNVAAWWPRSRRARGGNGRFCWRRSLRFERTTLLWWSLIWLALLGKGWFA